MKEESEKSWPKTQDSKTKIMASSAITSWEINVETVETVSDFIFSGSKITADCDSNDGIKKYIYLKKYI